MAAKLTIIGLGQIGTSIGLALAGRKDLLVRTGHDKEYALAQKAQKLGAVDGIQFNLPASVQDADIVIIATPLEAVRDTLDVIAPDLKEGAVVLDTSPVKAQVLEWAKAYLPAKRHYVGLVPAINPLYLHESAVEQDAAHADLFKDGLMGIVAPFGTPGDAIKLASDLAELLGSHPFYMDVAESDGLMAHAHLLPQLMAAALVNAATSQPGWIEARKLAGRAYARVGSAVTSQDVMPSLRAAALANRENTLRVLDNAIQSLTALRNAVSEDAADSLVKQLENAFESQMKWEHQRQKGDWTIKDSAASHDDITPGSVFRQMFFGKWGKDKKK